MRLITSLLLISLLGCAAPAASTPTTTPKPAPGAMVETQLDPVAGATAEPNPILTIDADAIDDLTGKPVTATWYWIPALAWHEPLREPFGRDLIISGVDKIQLNMPARSVGWLVVDAAGYERWELRISHNILNSRAAVLPVRMTKARSGL